MEKTYSHESLKQFAVRVFVKMGCPEDQAAKAAEILIAADLHGIDSHGVARLKGYVRLWEVGRVNTSPNIKIVHETPSTAVVDGDSGLGLVVAPAAMKVAMEKAEELVRGGAYDIVILDEITVAIDFNLISVQGVIDLIENKPDNLELILTGRTCPEALIERADLVSRIDEIKHPYQKGLQARKGIEF